MVVVVVGAMVSGGGNVMMCNDERRWKIDEHYVVLCDIEMSDGNNEKLGHLWRLAGAKERLELVRADLMEEGSFDDAIMGCHGVFHIASPVLGQPSSDPKAEILIPAIEGTLNILSSCKKNPSLKRVILTSSSSTVRARDDFDPNVPLDESSWSSVELCERL
ncbi:hypothetical protein ACSBR1_040208 [Camellia fascicularis]